MTHIEDLILDQNDLDDSCLLMLAKSHLKGFDVFYNNITEKGVDLIIENATQASIGADSMQVGLAKRAELTESIKRRKRGEPPIPPKEPMITYCFNHIKKRYGWLLGVSNTKYASQNKENAPKSLKKSKNTYIS